MGKGGEAEDYTKKESTIAQKGINDCRVKKSPHVNWVRKSEDGKKRDKLLVDVKFRHAVEI